MINGCQPNQSKTPHEKEQQIVRERQAQEKTVYNNPKPITGFEHSVQFELLGKKLLIPYGYLTKYTKNHAEKWLSDMAQPGYYGSSVEIWIHPKKTADGWLLEPFNQGNQAHFLKELRDGLGNVDKIVISNHECRLGPEALSNMLSSWGHKKIPSLFPEFTIFEKKGVPENPKYHEITLIKNNINPVIITQSYGNQFSGYNASTSSCFNGLIIEYYPLGKEVKLLSQQELINYHQQVERLIQSFFIN